LDGRLDLLKQSLAFLQMQNVTIRDNWSFNRQLSSSGFSHTPYFRKL
jgi:hypothetical protein